MVAFVVRRLTWRHRILSLGWLLALTGVLLIPALHQTRTSAAGPCDPPIASAIVCENSLPGAPASEWDVLDPDPSIEGFTTDISVDQGGQVQFKIRTSSTNYRIDIYRLGYYGGQGARKVATIQPSASLPQSQPACLSQSATGLIDCGNWATSATWNVPVSVVSGIYIAKLVREDPEDGRANHVYFVVRDDDGGSDVLFQTADTTWQAYNGWGGSSLYTGQPDGRAYKVSYNRPFSTRFGPVIGGIQSFLFNAEYPMVRWLEANGYDVSYTTGVDTDRRGAELLEHELFLSNGHDEYWSAAQRTNVEAARNAGVHLAFFSGNEVFWKHRWETSIASGGAAHRTLVVYKETIANAKIDPTPTWTGTWRDPRFSPPSDGGQPENALTGQLFMVNGVENWEMRVPAEDGKMRFWRNTSVANLAAGQTATLPHGTLGYEWDEVPDNGLRPAGLFRLSRTTHDVTPLYLQNFGSVYGAGTATHSLSLYRHSSGALVFGAGTVQWAWGLDAEHDNEGEPADPRMQQATVNLFADMGVQPGSLQAGLVAASASTDASAPTSQITSPANGATVVTGTPVVISGTATDSGGRVAGVEVSTDGGATWREATGRGSWSYSWTPTQLGQVTLRSRAVDDSGNIESPSAGRTITVTHAACPCSVWTDSTTPAVPSQTDPQQVEVGVKFQTLVDGYITGVEFYKGTGNTGTHTGNLWTSSGTLLATAVFTNETATGWQRVTFPAPVPVTANTTYVASYHTTSGRYAVNANYFVTAGVTTLPLKALSNAEGGGNGVYKYGPSGFPNQTYGSSNYWVDPVFHTLPVDPVAPSVKSRTPVAGAVQVGTFVSPAATFTEPVTPASVAIVVRRPDNSSVPGTVSYDANTGTASFQPASPLAVSTTYSVTVSGATDPAGNVMAPDSWSFTTVTCPCSIWTNATVPTGGNQNDGQPLELGFKFQPQMDGWVTGVRFHKGAGNTGTHTGSLWATDGTLLATATFTNETASGWQEVTFPAPVQVTANTTYVVSYHNPTGSYRSHVGYFANSGVTTTPLVALQNGIAGGNGVYRYGASAFPNQNFSSSNYWVDVAFNAVFVDPIPPSVLARTPAPDATEVPTDASVTATFSEPVNPGSISFVLRRPDNSIVPASTSYDGPSRTATLVPAEALAYGVTYTASLTGATDGGGNLMAPATWSFTTVLCPCSIWDDTTIPTGTAVNDGQPLELGVKFRPSVDGYVTGIRFYKGAGNTGIHVGSLWDSSGTLLASAIFLNETASGWQQVLFATPVAVTANTVYVASYHNPAGNYISSRDHFVSGITNWPLTVPSSAGVGGNGVYKIGANGFPNQTYSSSNYWVDLSFTISPPGAGDDDAPIISGVQATSPDTSTATVSWSTNEPATTRVEYGTTTAYGSEAPAIPSNALVTAHSQQLTGLAPNTTYHYRVVSRDVAGNEAPSSDRTFTTQAPACPCSIWSPGSAPQNPSVSDTSALELGVRFQSNVAGFVTGVRFYKGALNTGVHTGSLWSASGQLLATATFTNETATGWQQVTFSSPVAITAGTTYVASYHTDTGGYARDQFYFSGGPVVNPPLQALQAGNGAFAFGPSSFPNQSFNSTNYWVDVVFVLN